MKQQAQREEEAFEEFCREVVQAARADEEVVNAAADSVFLYQRVRAQLATEPELKSGFFIWPFGGRRFQWWALGVTAMSAIVVTVAMMRWPRETPQPPVFPIAAKSVDNAPTLAAIQQRGKTEALARHPKPMASPRWRATRTEQEVATEYLPLTYVAQAEEAESGHVVRVRMPRAALATLGVPVGVEPPGEMIKADVIVGDDGLARAIRFVR